MRYELYMSYVSYINRARKCTKDAKSKVDQESLLGIPSRVVSQ